LIALDAPAAIKKMVPGQLLEFKPSKFNPAREIVTGMKGVLEVQTYGALLHIFVDNVERRRSQIEAALKRQKITCSEMRQIEPRMEEAFISLISRQEAENNV
jgi:hypothetical protein